MAEIITREILQEFKDRMRLDDGEDENLMRILKASCDDLKKICGDYDIGTDERFKELVFERSRYVYNDALEYFHNNFLTQINNLNLGKVLESIELEGDSTATV
ncbi:hypothetical protein L3476_13930 [Paenibacillus thiaminolyticus]|uniref:hypothetical protein n=1 Tax=Paenibacillus thiaminolyticus TaxID=49283 RepID=UPI002350024F|nr:hypothetical protein [Paenibacillus thiaminolyticus]WCR29720.1 hypothetical protein L3476_13930 [Paenibacillus thiaminolyticus]